MAIVVAVKAATTTVNTTGTGADAPKVEASVTLLAQRITPVPEGAYVERSPIGLSISSSGWVPAFRAAVANNQVPVFVHTHPNGIYDRPLPGTHAGWIDGAAPLGT